MATIGELRTAFNGYSRTQKKQFIANIRKQVMASNNAEHRRFLNECIQKYNAEIREILRDQQQQQQEQQDWQEQQREQQEEQRESADTVQPIAKSTLPTAKPAGRFLSKILRRK